MPRGVACDQKIHTGTKIKKAQTYSSARTYTHNTHTHTLSLSLTHTHSHTHSLTHTHHKCRAVRERHNCRPDLALETKI